jgi:chemotaxis signal transduction protein
MSGRYLSGIATIKERMILILDLSEVLNLGEPLLDIATETAAAANRSM